jgi:phosphohistidine phosphatase
MPDYPWETGGQEDRNMRLYLVQHGHALAKDVDPDRPLSAQGRAEVGRVAAFLARAGVQAGHVVHSGKTRARQTAERLAAAIAPGAPVEARSGIDPNDDPEPVALELATWDRDGLLVGHLPFLGKLVSRLCEVGLGRELVVFSPGSVVCLERRDEGSWAVAWMIRPEITG